MINYFKARNKFNPAEWVYGDLVQGCHTRHDAYIKHTRVIKGVLQYVKTFIDEGTVCRNTFVKDTKGNFIYEGDIVVYKNKPTRYVVVWYEHMWGLKNEETNTVQVCMGTGTYDVVGNIYDYKEAKQS